MRKKDRKDRKVERKRGMGDTGGKGESKIRVKERGRRAESG